MALVTSTGSRIMTGLTATPSVLADAGEGGGRVKVWSETVETSAADSIGSTYLMARLPSNARIFGASKLYHDALGTATCELDIGLYKTHITQGFTDDADALNDGIVASTAGAKDFVKDKANYGKRLWEYINGVTTDPKGDIDVKVVTTVADLSSGAGTMTIEIYYAVD